MDDAAARAALGGASGTRLHFTRACLLPTHDAGLRTVDGHPLLQCAFIGISRIPRSGLEGVRRPDYLSPGR